MLHGALDVKPKVHNIRLFENIVLAFETEQTLFLYLRFRPTSQQIVVVIDFV